MTVRRARIYDLFALLTALVVIGLDQWTKALVVEHLSPPDYGPQVSLVGPYLLLHFIRNTGAAFSMFETNGPVLFVLILLAVGVIGYLYLRMANTGSLPFKLIFGMIIGGAAGNLFDRAMHGSVVDFVQFQIPQIGFIFAVFNMADAAISVGVVLLLVNLLFGGRHGKQEESAALTQETEASELPQERHAQS